MPAEAKSHWYKSAVGALPWELRERCRKKVRLSPGSFSMWNCFVDCPDAGLENRMIGFSVSLSRRQDHDNRGGSRFPYQNLKGETAIKTTKYAYFGRTIH